MKRYLSTIEVAERLGIDVKEVDELCIQGKLEQAYQRYENGPWRIPIESADRYLARQKKPIFSRDAEPSTITIPSNQVKSSTNIELTKVDSAMDKPPNIWALAWNRIPIQLRPLTVVIVVMFFILVAVTNLLDNINSLIPKTPQATPTLIADWTITGLGSQHLMREGLSSSYGGCHHDMHAVDLKHINTISLASEENINVEMRMYGIPIAPSTLMFEYSQEKRSQFDETVITSLQLHIDEYIPVKEPLAIIISRDPCAEGYLPPNLLGSLLINPTQKTYDVLTPRFTSQNTEGIMLEGMYEPFRVDVNALEPGMYHLSLTIQYIVNGQNRTFDSLHFSMFVPDVQQVQSVYTLGILGPLSSVNAIPFFNAYSESTARFLRLDYFEGGANSTGAVGPYTYLVNLGRDINLTGWTLKQNEVVLFTFPDFILQAGFGVRVWPIEGVNSQSDLFGAQRIISNMEENYITFDLYDPLGNRFTSYFKSVVP